jgi:hypothetical protein
MNGVIQPPNNVIIDNSYTYPFGTTEQFPQMQDSDLQDLSDSAHYYMECSNKGKCDRTTGECQCYDGYDGVACQRASCPGFPNSCSGHGVCKTIEQLASADNGNVYKLWDRKTTMGCACDKGYSGPDCSQRDCKYGVDPLYLDDVATVKASVFDFATLTTGTVTAVTDSTYFTNGEAVIANGHWAIRFFDNHGEDWVTDPIAGGADCDHVVAALEGLPNDVIPDGSLVCTRSDMKNKNEHSFSIGTTTLDSDPSLRHSVPLIYKLALWEARTPNSEGEISDYSDTRAYFGSNDTSTTTLSGFIYRVKFTGNPGKLMQPEIEVHLDGRRPSLVSSTAAGKVVTKVWTDGQQGEDVDNFADHCDGVSVTIGTVKSFGGYKSFLTGMTTTEKNLLKKCLGDSDFDDTNNQDVYNWDKGSKRYPHIIKLVRTVTTAYDGGYYAVIWYDTKTPYEDQTKTEGTFRLLNPFSPPDALLTDNYDVYTTKGTLALTTDQAEATFGFASKYVYTTNVTYDVYGYNSSAAFDGDISCEVGNNNALKMNSIFHCMNKTDQFTLLNWEWPQANPRYINLYTAERLYTGHYKHSVEDRFKNMYYDQMKLEEKELHYMTHFINTDLATNWAASVGNFTYDSTAFPVTKSNDFGKPMFHVYKFFPATASSYEYVAQCSNRGLCDADSGVCQCFPGYTNDNCDTQSSLAV